MKVEFLGIDKEKYQAVLASYLDNERTRLAGANVLFVSANFLSDDIKSKAFDKLIVEYSLGQEKQLSHIVNSFPVDYVILENDINMLVDAFDKVKIDIEKRLSKPNLGFLFYRLSHDLRSPLVSIEGLVDLIKDEGDLNARGVYGDLILKSVKRLDLSLSKILDMANFEREEGVQFSEVDIDEIIDRVIDSLKFLDGFKEVDFQILKDQKAVFYSDPELIESLFQNLIQNAIKYMDYNQDSPKILVQYQIDANNVSFRVCDNGVGIDEVAKEKVFDMFYRGQSDIPGSGLGLYIVKQTVGKLNGIMRVIEGVDGKGIGFEIILKNNY